MRAAGRTTGGNAVTLANERHRERVLTDDEIVRIRLIEAATAERTETFGRALHSANEDVVHRDVASTRSRGSGAHALL